jgi:glycosyltransferase involved in cell wall biosynthesis
MAEYYAASDLLIFPSIADNCPLVVLEAMACGTPVIAFNTEGAPESVNRVELFLSDDDLILSGTQQRGGRINYE